MVLVPRARGIPGRDIWHSRPLSVCAAPAASDPTASAPEVHSAIRSQRRETTSAVPAASYSDKLRRWRSLEHPAYKQSWSFLKRVCSGYTAAPATSSGRLRSSRSATSREKPSRAQRWQNHPFLPDVRTSYPLDWRTSVGSHEGTSPLPPSASASPPPPTPAAAAPPPLGCAQRHRAAAFRSSSAAVRSVSDGTCGPRERGTGQF